MAEINSPAQMSSSICRVVLEQTGVLGEPKHNKADGNERHFGTSGFRLPVALRGIGCHRFGLPGQPQSPV